MSESNRTIRNRGEAIDHLFDSLSSESVIMAEFRDKLGSSTPRLLWLFRSPEIAMGFEEEDSHWLIDDSTVITTSIHRPNRTEAYKEATGQNTPSKTKELLQIEAGMVASQERTLGASFDDRLVGILDVVWDPRYYPLDYEKIATIMDDIEAKYELKPIEMIEAYQMCEDRKKVEMEVEIDAQA